MHLKRLQLLGFKTFADKTEIEIGSGMTAIVGPNGSGKSNIVDALLWVLGEQNPRLLRGNAAQDVIFSGTDKRKPLGMAEVRLTIDNTDGALPVKFAEVVVTRRIYRSGESQYLINNAPCRLKDIVELFLDTGVGKGAYAFVSQQEIDAVLSARPEDRRELFEEAAGIKKYRVKKREAMRRLESAEANLDRVRDIVAEIETQREPMEQQAIAARRYLLLQERLHEIEVGLLVAELQKADYDLRAGQGERDADQAALLRNDAEMARLDRAASETSARLTEAEHELEAARRKRDGLATAAERAESRAAILTERTRSAGVTREQADAELKSIAERMKTLEAEIAESSREKVEAEALESGRNEEWSGRKAALAELEAALRAALRRSEERHGERLRRAEQRASLDAALKAACEWAADVSARRERLASESAALAVALVEAQRRSSAALESHRLKKVDRDALAQRREALETALKQRNSDLAQVRSALESSRRSLAEQSSRLTTLTELQQNHEGFYQGVRAVLSALKRGQLSGHYRAVVDLLAVPEPYRVAIEVALGGSLQDVVTLTESEAKSGIEWLKQNRAGRATFLALPLLRPGQRAAVPSADNSGAVCAMDIVSCERQYEPVLQLLLGRTLIAPDMDSAIALSRRANGWSKIVTHEGELLTPGGALTGGSLQTRGAHLVGRKGEIDDLTKAVPALRLAVDKRAAEMEALQGEIRGSEEERGRIDRQDSILASEVASASGAAAAADRDIARIERDQKDHNGAQTSLAGTAESVAADIARLTAEVQAGSAEQEHAEDAFVALSEETASLASRRDACRASAVTLEVEITRLREKRDGLRRSLATAEASLAGLRRQQAARIAERDSAETTSGAAADEQARLQTELAVTRTELAEADAALKTVSERRQSMLASNMELTAALREQVQKRGLVSKSLHDTELRLARLEVQISQAAARLQDEYNIDREEALARPDDVAIDKSTAMEVGRLRRELRGMGQVNTGAVAEYDRLTERYDFLTTQRADLDRSRESLMKTIGEIDESTRGVFQETFEAVRIEFERIFTRLFEGGTTKLVLTKPDDVLETGIDVIAQPPGKKPQSLSLLSGGERALTATALLFAFLAVRPSPFVLLDEVDAPLDGVNVEKFTNLVRDFSARSQFLLITHNPTTMEAAPNWYGITMRQPGVSSVLSYRVPAEATAGSGEPQAVVLEGPAGNGAPPPALLEAT